MATQFSFDFTLNHLKQIVSNNPHIGDWYNALVAILPEYDIETEHRVAAFIAQCAHESGNFRFITENLNYKWQSLRKVFPKYFPDDSIAQQYANMPNRQEAIANRVYANRMGNGSEASGDGFKYRGRGLIQLTGKTNYENYAMSLEIDVDEAVEHLKTFEGCVQSAAWFWDENKLNTFADRKDIVTLSKRINGGTIGLEDRIKHYNHALHVLGVD
jgi:putative chitinase